jgi:hypothetical protein
MKTIQELSYDAGYYRACKSEGCHAPLKYLDDNEFQNMPVKNIDPLQYEAGFESGLKECLKHKGKLTDDISLLELAEPIISYLKKHWNPHTKVIVTQYDVELLVTEMFYPVRDDS